MMEIPRSTPHPTNLSSRKEPCQELSNPDGCPEEERGNQHVPQPNAREASVPAGMSDRPAFGPPGAKQSSPPSHADEIHAPPAPSDEAGTHRFTGEKETTEDSELEQQAAIMNALYLRKGAGICCVPASVEQKRILLPGESVSKWNRFQAALPTAEDMRTWLSANSKIGGVAVVCGKVSRGLVCLDYDLKNDPSQGKMWVEFKRALPPVIYKKLVVESTQSGGNHAFFRTEVEMGNVKLAARSDDRTKIPLETRGEGGYAICAPSRGYVLCQGELNKVTQLDAAEVSEIWMAARAAAIHCGCVWLGDENSSKEQATSNGGKNKAVLTPIDDYNDRGDAVELMKAHGWSISQERPDGTIHLTRPGKDVGTSATWNYHGSRRLSVFTTCSEFATSPSTYGAGAIYAILQCQGDFTKAASDLRKLGYGDPARGEANSADDSLWPDPAPLCHKADDFSKSLPNFDLKLLPSVFRPWVDDIATNMLAPPETAAVAAMISLSSLAARRFVIQPKVNDPWTEFANLWGMVIGPPSAMKTPAVSLALSPLRSLVKQASLDYEIEINGYSALSEDLKRVQPLPKMRRYMVNDVTAPALAEVLINNDYKSIILYQDEISSLLHQVSQKDGQQLKGIMLQGWKGVEPYVLDRIERGVRCVDAFSISVLGTIQPDRLNSLLLSTHSGTNSGDGLLQRFGMLVYPDQLHTCDYMDRPLNSGAYDLVQKVFERIANPNIHPLPSGLKIHKEWNVPILRFDSEAQELFAKWVVKHLHFLRSSKLPPVLEAHYTKYNKLIVTIAALLHVSDYPSDGAISYGTLERSIAWIDLLRAHAEKIFSHRQTISDENQMALQLAKRLIEKYGSDTRFTARDVGRNGWTGFTDTEFTNKILTILTDKNWLKVEESASRKTSRYRVNPKSRQHLAGI